MIFLVLAQRLKVESALEGLIIILELRMILQNIKRKVVGHVRITIPPSNIFLLKAFACKISSK